MYIGIDVGGMSIKAGVVNHEGKIIAKSAVPTPVNDNDAFLKAMLECVKKAVSEAGIKTEDIESFGIGSPGIVNRNEGILIEANNIGYSDVPVREYLQKNFGDIPVLVENDANCAALGEFYNSESSGDFVFITLGTGVGGGIVINGKLFTGSNGAAGELGHIVTHADGIKCSCGRSGCWEAYASVTALIRETQEHRSEIKGISPDEKISGRTVFDLAKDGDADAQRVRDAWIDEVAIGLVDIVNIFRPDELVIGGAISKEGDVILKPICRYINENSYCAARLPKQKVVASRIGGDAGIIGAALLYKNKNA